MSPNLTARYDPRDGPRTSEYQTAEKTQTEKESFDCVPIIQGDLIIPTIGNRLCASSPMWIFFVRKEGRSLKAIKREDTSISELVSTGRCKVAPVLDITPQPSYADWDSNLLAMCDAAGRITVFDMSSADGENSTEKTVKGFAALPGNSADNCFIKSEWIDPESLIAIGDAGSVWILNTLQLAEEFEGSNNTVVIQSSSIATQIPAGRGCTPVDVATSLEESSSERRRLIAIAGNPDSTSVMILHGSSGMSVAPDDALTIKPDNTPVEKIAFLGSELYHSLCNILVTVSNNSKSVRFWRLTNKVHLLFNITLSAAENEWEPNAKLFLEAEGNTVVLSASGRQSAVIFKLDPSRDGSLVLSVTDRVLSDEVLLSCCSIRVGIEKALVSPSEMLFMTSKTFFIGKQSDVPEHVSQPPIRRATTETIPTVLDCNHFLVASPSDESSATYRTRKHMQSAVFQLHNIVPLIRGEFSTPTVSNRLCGGNPMWLFFVRKEGRGLKAIKREDTSISELVSTGRCKVAPVLDITPQPSYADWDSNLLAMCDAAGRITVFDMSAADCGTSIFAELPSNAADNCFIKSEWIDSESLIAIGDAGSVWILNTLQLAEEFEGSNNTVVIQSSSIATQIPAGRGCTPVDVATSLEESSSERRRLIAIAGNPDSTSVMILHGSSGMSVAPDDALTIKPDNTPVEKIAFLGSELYHSLCNILVTVSNNSKSVRFWRLTNKVHLLFNITLSAAENEWEPNAKLFLEAEGNTVVLSASGRQSAVIFKLDPSRDGSLVLSVCDMEITEKQLLSCNLPTFGKEKASKNLPELLCITSEKFFLGKLESPDITSEAELPDEICTAGLNSVQQMLVSLQLLVETSHNKMSKRFDTIKSNILKQQESRKGVITALKAQSAVLQRVA